MTFCIWLIFPTFSSYSEALKFLSNETFGSKCTNKAKISQKSTVLKMSRTSILHNNIADKLLTNWPKKSINNPNIFFIH